MSKNVVAFRDEYNDLAQELAAARRQLNASIRSIEAEISAVAGTGGPLQSRQISLNVAALLRHVRSDLIRPNEINLDNLEHCLDSFMSGIDHHDRQ